MSKWTGLRRLSYNSRGRGRGAGGGEAAAFPVVEATATSAVTTAAISHSVDLPTGVSADDLLVVFFYVDNLRAISWSDEWTELFEVDPASGDLDLSVAYRVADGTEGSTITVETDSDTRSAHVAYRISGAASPPEINALGGGFNDSPDPPSLSPTWGAANTLWLVAACADQVTIDAIPTNYANEVKSQIISDHQLSTARRELAASSEDPGTFTLSADNWWIAATVAIEPAA